MRLELFSDDRGSFRSVRNRRVLIFWPHGFGDFVHLSLITRLLEPSNRYFITRFGDDFVHLYDNDAVVEPLYSGVQAIGNGANCGIAPNFGLVFDRLARGMYDFDFPETMLSSVREAGIDSVLACRYPEITGRVPYPFHTKARYLAHQLIARERLRWNDLSKPLRSSLTFRAPGDAQATVEARLRDVVPTGDRLYLISPGGHTHGGKEIPDAVVEDFAKILRERDSCARIISIDERTSSQIGRNGGLAPTTADLFAGAGLPFAHVLLALLRVAHGLIGAAAGPLHCALAAGIAPVVGIWRSHWPEYYDEPSSNALHLVGPRVYRDRLDLRIGAITKRQAGVLPYSIREFRHREPTADDIVVALEELGALR